MQEHLAHEPPALKRVGQVDAVCAPDQMSWGYGTPARCVHFKSWPIIISQDGSRVKQNAVSPDRYAVLKAMAEAQGRSLSELERETVEWALDLHRKVGCGERHAGAAVPRTPNSERRLGPPAGSAHLPSCGFSLRVRRNQGLDERDQVGQIVLHRLPHAR